MISDSRHSLYCVAARGQRCPSLADLAERLIRDFRLWLYAIHHVPLDFQEWPLDGFPASSLDARSGRDKTVCTSCLGCKRSRVQIPAARPNSSNTYSQNIPLILPSGVHLESKTDAGPAASSLVLAGVFANTQNRSKSSGALYSYKNPTFPTFGI